MSKTETMLALQIKFQELSEMLDIYAEMRYNDGLKEGTKSGYEAGREDGITEGIRQARMLIATNFQKPLGITPVAERGAKPEPPAVDSTN